MVAWCQRAGRGQLRTRLVDREIFWTVAGRRLLVDLACSETQEEHLWNVDLRGSDDCDGANGHPASAGVVHSQCSSCCTSPACSSSLGVSLDEPGTRSTRPGVHLAADAYRAYGYITIGEAKEIVANSRKNLVETWRRLQKRPDSTAGGRKRNLLHTVVSPERCSLRELQAGMERRESAVSQYEEKSKNKMNDEIKLAGLEALVPKELEEPLILNSNRLRTFEDARREVVTYVEKQFGFLKFVIPSRVTRVLREHSEVGAVNSLLSVEGKGSPCLSAMEPSFNETAMQARTQTRNCLAKAIKASHGPRVSPQSQAEDRVKKTMNNPNGSPNEPKVRSKFPKAQATVRH